VPGETRHFDWSGMGEDWADYDGVEFEEACEALLESRGSAGAYAAEGSVWEMRVFLAAFTGARRGECW
jgi:hypothetical protein